MKIKKKKKKKVFTENLSGFPPKLGEELGLFRQIIKRLNLDGSTPKSRWGNANSRWGDASPRVPPTILVQGIFENEGIYRAMIY